MTSFITDMGSSIELTADEGWKMHIPRYGVWQYSRSKQKFEVTETSDDLDAMQEKYGPGLRVFKQDLYLLDPGGRQH